MCSRLMISSSNQSMSSVCVRLNDAYHQSIHIHNTWIDSFIDQQHIEFHWSNELSNYGCSNVCSRQLNNNTNITTLCIWHSMDATRMSHMACSIAVLHMIPYVMVSWCEPSHPQHKPHQTYTIPYDVIHTCCMRVNNWSKPLMWLVYTWCIHVLIIDIA